MDKEICFGVTGTCEDTDTTLIFPHFDDVLDMVRQDLLMREVDEGHEYKITVLYMTEEELKNLPEAE